MTHFKASGRWEGLTPKEQSSIKYYSCMKLNFPELYQDEKFMTWLTGRHHSAIATWHEGEGANEFSDIFIWYDHGEGSDSDMPEHCWDALRKVAKEEGFEEGMIWLTNLES